MLKIVAKLIMWVMGWKVDYNLPEGVSPSVMIAAPHTSNWDFVYMRCAFELLDLPCRYTVKKSFMTPPLGWLMGYLGAIPVDRSPKKPGDDRKSLVQAMADLFENQDDRIVVVTPEGTRSLRTEWKSGYYHTAKLAGVPITFGYLDYKKKIAGVAGIIHLTDDMDADMREIMKVYKPIAPKFPEKYSVDLRFDETIPASEETDTASE
ncbi:MAG: 1-acyl-sn-glycerol-3-phosphate acyltransferase [Bacteroidota bacterium]